MEDRIMDNPEIVNRWRLILGDFAENSLPLDPESGELDNTLYFLYNREYTDEQGIRNDFPNRAGRGDRPGMAEESKETVP
jgi:hypothetical protein